MHGICQSEHLRFWKVARSPPKFMVPKEPKLPSEGVGGPVLLLLKNYIFAVQDWLHDLPVQ